MPVRECRHSMYSAIGLWRLMLGITALCSLVGCGRTSFAVQSSKEHSGTAGRFFLSFEVTRSAFVLVRLVADSTLADAYTGPVDLYQPTSSGARRVMRVLNYGNHFERTDSHVENGATLVASLSILNCS